MEICLLSNHNPFYIIQHANDITLGKDRVFQPLPLNEQMEWAIMAMIAEHSTLEFVDILIESDIRSDVCHQIVRHTAYHPRHVVQSFRPDWTGKKRPEPHHHRKYLGKWSPKALFAMARQRLCYKAMQETRHFVEHIKKNLNDSSDFFLNAVGWAMVPECVYRNGCPFKKPCGFYEGFMATDKNNIKSRYDSYQHWMGK